MPPRHRLIYELRCSLDSVTSDAGPKMDECQYPKANMSEADWWLCGNCQSLNSLSARKCYSCRQRKPKHAVLASDYLGYDAVESWDGKVDIQTRQPPDDIQPEGPALPIREPIRRDILAVAPRPPHGVRIVYRDAPDATPPGLRPAVAVGPGLPQEGQGPGPRPAIPVTPPPNTLRPGSASLFPARPALSQVAPRREPRPLFPGRPGAPSAEERARIARHEEQLRSHWHQLLDTPTPNAQLMRTAGEDEGGSSGARLRDGARHDGLALHNALRDLRLRTGTAEHAAPRIDEIEGAEAETPASEHVEDGDRSRP